MRRLKNPDCIRADRLRFAVIVNREQQPGKPVEIVDGMRYSFHAMERKNRGTVGRFHVVRCIRAAFRFNLPNRERINVDILQDCNGTFRAVRFPQHCENVKRADRCNRSRFLEFFALEFFQLFALF